MYILNFIQVNVFCRFLLIKMAKEKSLVITKVIIKTENERRKAEQREEEISPTYIVEATGLDITIIGIDDASY